jgi:hypothetical protein
MAGDIITQRHCASAVNIQQHLVIKDNLWHFANNLKVIETILEAGKHGGMEAWKSGVIGSLWLVACGSLPYALRPTLTSLYSK